MAAKTVKAGVVITGKDQSASAFTSLSKSLSKSENKFKAFKSSMSGLAGGIGIISGVAVGAFAALGGAIAGVTYGMKQMLDATTAYADELGKFARQTGFGVERLQELDFIAKRNGISTDKLRGGIVKFTKSFTDLRLGTGTALTALEKIDPVLLAQLNGAKSADEGFALLLDRMMKIEDPVKRSTIAFAMFGKTGQQMLRLIDGGPKAFEALRLEARKFGIMTEEDTKKAEAYQDSVENLQTAIGGLRNSLSIGLMPALTEAATLLADFVAEHRTDIVQAFSGVIASTGEMVKNLIKYLADNPDAFKNFIGDAADTMKNFIDAVKDIQTFITDIKGFIGLGPDRQAVALARADTTIAGAVPKGIRGGIIGGAKAAINDIANKGPLEAIMSGPSYLLSQAVAAGVKAGFSGAANPNEVTVRFKNLPKDAVVETDRNGPLVTEEFNYFDATTW